MAHYHGKTRPPRMTEHKVELGFHVSASHGAAGTATAWKLENVGGKFMAKGDDVLAYRLVAACPLGQGQALEGATLIVKVWPLDPQLRRREGRPEVGFLVAPPPPPLSGGPPSLWYSTPAYSVVLEGPDRIRAIYFTLVDCNFDRAGLPLWQLSVDSSVLLAGSDFLGSRWVPLAPVHPDPAVDPGVPLEQRPQRDPRW